MAKPTVQTFRPVEDRAAVNWGLLAVRLAAGIIFVAHGGQKWGLFGGGGIGGIVGMLGPIGYLVAIAEFFGGLGLIVGFLSRFSAASLIVVMLGAITLVHAKNGFFQANQGYEFNLALIALLIPVLLSGPGALALVNYIRVPGWMR